MSEEYDTGNSTAVTTTMMDENDNEIIVDLKRPSCTKRRFQMSIIASMVITFISLCIVVPVVVIKGKNESAKVRASMKYGSTWFPLGNKLLAEVGDQEFGESVDLSSNGAVLAVGSNSINDHTGQVEVRQYTGMSWRLLGNIIPGNVKDENLGHTVQLSEKGRVLVAGGFGSDDYDDGTSVRGKVRGYQLNESEMKWEQLGSEITGQIVGDRFGVALSMSKDGTSWIAGADNFKGPGEERNGYAKVYSLYGGEWSQKGSTIFGLNGERTGYAVAMSGDGNTVCVGDRWYEVLDVGRRGRARCFTWNGADWNVKGTNYIVGTTEDGEMGYSLSLNYDGNRVAVGNRYGGDDRQGSVAIFRFKGNTWKMMGSEQVSMRRNDEGGFKVELNEEGNVLAWTARGYNGDGFDTGVVRVARWVDDKKWERLGNDLLGDDAKDYFGESVSLNDDGTIVAASANRGDVEYVRAFALN